MELINRNLFNRIEDNNWDTICQICCGLNKFEDIPEEHKHVFDSIKTLLNNNEENVLIDYLVEYFSIAIDCYKTREDAIIKVFVTILSFIDLDIKWNNNKIVQLFNNESKVRLEWKVLAFNRILELLTQNYSHLTLNTSFDFNSFIVILLENYDLVREEFVKCFDLMLTIDYQLIGDEKHLQQIIINCIPINEDSVKLISLKNQFFCTLFDVYFKLRKAIKLHEVMIEITNSLDSKLSLNQQFMRLYRKCIYELPFGQSFDLWKLFLDKFNINNIFSINLLTYFLLHIRCLHNNIAVQSKARINQSFDDTKKCLEKTTNSLTLNDKELTENLLELYFAWSSAIITQMTYNQSINSYEGIETIKPNEWWDMSIIYDFTQENTWKILFTKCAQMSPTLQQTLIKISFQKLQCLTIFNSYSDISENQKAVIKISISKLMSGLRENFASHINLFSYKQINTIVNHLNNNDLRQLSDSLISKTIGEDDEEKQCFKIEKLLLNGNIWENIEFQTAFVGSFWQQISIIFSNRKRKMSEELPKFDSTMNSLFSNDSVWFECPTDAPNVSKLNKMWSIIANASSHVEEVVQKHNSVKNIDKTIELMKIFANCVPLEYLLPGNQMRCLLGLSSLLFSIDFTVERNELLLKYIMDSILRIFDGVRSVWLFSFVNPANYMIKVLITLNAFNNRQKSRILISKLLDSILRNSQSSALYIEELRNKINENEDKLSFEVLIMSETILLKRCLHILNLKSVPKNMLQLKESCVPLSRELSNTVHNRVKKYLLKSEDFESLDSVLIVESFAAVFEFQVSKTSNEENIHLKTKWRKLLAKLIDISINQLTNKSINESCVDFLALLCLHRRKLENVLPEDFILNLWHVLCPAVDETQTKNLLNDCEIINMMSNKEKAKDLFENSLLTLEKNFEVFKKSISTENSYMTTLKPLVIELIKCSSSEEFEKFIEELIIEFRNFNYITVSNLSFLWNGMFETEFHLIEEKSLLFQKILNDLLTITVNHVQKCDLILSPDIQMFIKIPLLLIIRSIIHMTKNTITSPQLFLSFHACIEIHLIEFADEPNIFVALFESIYSVLNEVMLQHKYIAISSMATFNLIVENVLKGLMMASDERKFIKFDSITKHKMELCSKNMDRLLTLLASLENDYSSYAPHLIASYVTQTQCVSVHQTVKNNLLSGIYRVLKVITSKDSLEMIHCRLNQSSREIFKVLYSNYEKYYKFKGQI